MCLICGWIYDEAEGAPDASAADNLRQTWLIGKFQGVNAATGFSHGHPLDAVWLIAAFSVLQQLEGHVPEPRGVVPVGDPGVDAHDDRGG